MSAARLRLAELILHDQDVFVVAIGPHLLPLACRRQR